MTGHDDYLLLLKKVPRPQRLLLACAFILKHF